ncbi:MAG: hypothetical protein JJT94_07290 [Bernardetiaceae bacterium]|nr:hypothetical protein [Bernardetiaceae bacterium]
MKTFFTICFLLLTNSLLAADVAEISKGYFSINQQGMMLLGSWALLNILLSAAVVMLYKQPNTHFFLMNIYWNIVNLSIAAYAYWSATNPKMLNHAFEILQESAQMQAILLLNTGLDIAYIIGGFWLIERAKNTIKKPERLKGFGQSVIMQGAFLFVFDLIMYIVHRNHILAYNDWFLQL